MLWEFKGRSNYFQQERFREKVKFKATEREVKFEKVVREGGNFRLRAWNDDRSRKSEGRYWGKGSSNST